MPHKYVPDVVIPELEPGCYYDVTLLHLFCNLQSLSLFCPEARFIETVVHDMLGNMMRVACIWEVPTHASTSAPISFGNTLLRKQRWRSSNIALYYGNAYGPIAPHAVVLSVDLHAETASILVCLLRDQLDTAGGVTPQLLTERLRAYALSVPLAVRE